MKTPNPFTALFCLLLLVWGCGDEESSSQDCTANASKATAAIDMSECEVLLSLSEATIDEDARTIRVTATATNLTTRPLTLTTSHPCTHFVEWSGASASTDAYDYYAFCASGVCRPPDLPHTQVLAPNSETTLASLTLQLNGGACNEPIPKCAQLPLSFTLPHGDSNDPKMCGPRVLQVTTP